MLEDDKKPCEIEVSSICGGTSEKKRVVCNEVLREVRGKRCVWRGKMDGHGVILKEFVHPLFGWWNMIREWRAAMRLNKLGLPTPKVVKVGKAARGYVLLTEEIENGKDIQFFLSETRQPEQKFEVISEVVRVLAQMHDNGVDQTDLHLGNFLISVGKVYILDPSKVRFSRGGLGCETEMRQLAMIALSLNGDNELTSRLFYDYFECRSQLPSISFGEFGEILERQKEIAAIRAAKKAKRKAGLVGII